MTAETPEIAVLIQNDSGMDIPPYSVVMVTYVENTPETDTSETVQIVHVKQYDGSSGNILVTSDETIDKATVSSSSSSSAAASGWWSSGKSYGRAYADARIQVAIDQTIAVPTPGEQWGPKSGKWYITRGGSGFFADGFPTGTSFAGSSSSDTSVPDGVFAIFMRGTASTGGSGSGGGGGTGCGCCNCFNCLTPSQATVGGCSSAPDGAAYQYTINTGAWTAYPIFTPSGYVTLTYQCPTGCGSSSSSSSSTGCVADACTWVSCIYCVTQSSSSSSSSSSSGSPATGCYQFQGQIYTDGSGNPAFKCVPVLISGTDWLGIAETL